MLALCAALWTDDFALVQKADLLFHLPRRDHACARIDHSRRTHRATAKVPFADDAFSPWRNQRHVASRYFGRGTVEDMQTIVCGQRLHAAATAGPRFALIHARFGGERLAVILRLCDEDRSS